MAEKNKKNYRKKQNLAKKNQSSIYLKVLALSVLLVIILLIGIYFSFTGLYNLSLFKGSLNRFSKTHSKYCTITSKNLCEGKQVEIYGKLKDSKMVSGLGYLFEPDNSFYTITNPIYIKELGFSGRKLGWTEKNESFSHKIPFSSNMVVRGYVTIRDKYRCNNPNFLKNNSHVCAEDKYRVSISPDAIIEKPVKQVKSYTFSVYGEIKNLTNVIKDCPGVVDLCEGHEENYCYKVQLSTAQCDQIKQDPNMFLAKGYTVEGKENYFTSDFYQVTGINYSSVKVNQRAGDLINKYTKNDTSYFSIYDELGQKITRVFSGEKNYYDLNDVILAYDGAYYFVDNNVYFWSYEGEKRQLVTSLKPDLYRKSSVASDSNIGTPILSNDGETLVFRISTLISEKPFQPYVIRNYKYNIVKLDLDNFRESGAGDPIEPDVVYDQLFEGFVGLIKYDFNKDEALIYLTPDIEQKNPCHKYIYKMVDIDSGASDDVLEIFSQANKGCTEPIHKKMYISDNGKFLIFAQDFNRNLGLRPLKLETYKVTENGVESSVYLSNTNTMQNTGIEIVDVVGSLVYFVRPTSEKIEYTFNLQNDEFLLSNFEPVEYGVFSPNAPPFPGDGKQEQLVGGNVYLGGARLVHQNEREWFFWKRELNENKLYLVNKNTKETILSSTYSVFAKPHSVGSDFYVVDWDY